MPSKRVRLIHWNAEEAEERAGRLHAAGYEVDWLPIEGPDLLNEMFAHPPGALVVDLGRLPSQGREVALAIRHRGSTRHVPLVFVDGKPAKVERVRELLPDAVYTTWSRIGPALEGAIDRPPADPVVPSSRMASYAKVPLVKKLGIKEGSTICLVDAPEGVTLRDGRAADPTSSSGSSGPRRR